MFVSGTTYQLLQLGQPLDDGASVHLAIRPSIGSRPACDCSSDVTVAVAAVAALLFVPTVTAGIFFDTAADPVPVQPPQDSKRKLVSPHKHLQLLFSCCHAVTTAPASTSIPPHNTNTPVVNPPSQLKLHFLFWDAECRSQAFKQQPLWRAQQSCRQH
jgi:hypothetical protein